MLSHQDKLYLLIIQWYHLFIYASIKLDNTYSRNSYTNYFTMFKHVGILLLFLYSVKSAFSANILYLAPVPSPSHHIWNRALALGLVKKGHNVTHITPDENKGSSPQNYTHILIEGLYEDINETLNINEMAEFGPTQMLFEMTDLTTDLCKLTLKSKGLQKLLKYPPDFKFDLIIVDVTMDYCLYPLIQKFNYPPTVAVTPFLLPSYVSYNFGNHLFPSYIPWYGLPYTTEMNFAERIWNHIFTYFCLIVRNYKLVSEENKITKEFFGENTPSVKEIERHITLVLANSDPILDHPQPIPPNIIPVGGLHTRKSQKITQDLQNIVDNSKNGVILFSLGTNVRSDKLDNKTRRGLLEAFGNISQTVIWKFESEIENLPKNVVVRKWLPQNDILGHPNVKLFIGHGGALSTQEAIFHGVPMVAIPFIVDQYINARIIVKKKIGVAVDFKSITTDYFLGKLREVLDNPVYHENMKQISRLYYDRSETPLERGIFWIEYMLRNGGANFLNTPARDMSFFVSTGLDVITFLVFVIFISILILYKIIRAIFLKPFVKTDKVKTH